MQLNNLYILSGPIQSGKSTGLLKWVMHNSDVLGILQYRVNMNRIIYDIGSNTKRNLEPEKTIDYQKQIRIGNHIFNNDTFIWAQDKLLYAFSQKPNWLIIDEFGKLELDNQGLEPAISKILTSLDKQPHTKLIVVIRESLKHDFLKRYNLLDKSIKDFKLNN